MNMLRVVAVALSMAVVAPVQAAFLGDYDYSKWNASLSYNGNAPVEFGGETCVSLNCTSGNGDLIYTAPPSGVVLENATDGISPGARGLQLFSFTAEFDTLIGFDWLYESDGSDDGFFSRFGYSIDDIFVGLASYDGEEVFLVLASGSVSGLLVSAGQTFAFLLEANGREEATVTISNFTATRAQDSSVPPNSVPAPATLALLGLGLMGMAYGQRRRVR